MNIKAFAELLDVPYRTLQNYLLNECDPSAELLIKVSDVLNVDLNWLMRGEEEIFRSPVNESKLDKKEKQLIDHYRKMSSDMQIAFDISFKFLSNIASKISLLNILYL